MGLQRDGHGNLFFDRQRQEMRNLPSREDVDQAFPPQRHSSLYSLGQTQGRGPGIMEEPSSYRERKPEVIYKIGKRGQTKLRRTNTKPPKRQTEHRPAEHRSFAMGDG